MEINDSIVQSYLRGDPPSGYGDSWVFRAVNGAPLFDPPRAGDRPWVSRLCEKLKAEIGAFVPRNAGLVEDLFPDFGHVSRGLTVMLVVGFPDPYDAMVLGNDGEEYVVLDLVQFGADSLDESYSCQRVLTHELVHVCLHNRYPDQAVSYLDRLSYIAFDEGFAHALSYVEDIASFRFDAFHREKYSAARSQLALALKEQDTGRRSEHMQAADTGDYWDKFASIGGKLYLLNNVPRIRAVYEQGWRGFIDRVMADPA